MKRAVPVMDRASQLFELSSWAPRRTYAFSGR